MELEWKRPTMEGVARYRRESLDFWLVSHNHRELGREYYK